MELRLRPLPWPTYTTWSQWERTTITTCRSQRQSTTTICLLVIDLLLLTETNFRYWPTKPLKKFIHGDVVCTCAAAGRQRQARPRQGNESMAKLCRGKFRQAVSIMRQCLSKRNSQYTNSFRFYFCLRGFSLHMMLESIGLCAIAHRIFSLLAFMYFFTGFRNFYYSSVGQFIALF